MSDDQQTARTPHAGDLLGAAIAGHGEDRERARDRLGYSRAMIDQLVRGERIPSLPKAFEIEDLYGVAVAAWRGLAQPNRGGPS